MDKKINNFDFDFMPIGQAIKKAREAKKVTREQLAEIVDYSARHIQSVENEGQHPSFELFIQLITMFDVSVALYETGVTAEYGDRLITLSTCEYSAQNGRLVVVAKKTA